MVVCHFPTTCPPPPSMFLTKEQRLLPPVKKMHDVQNFCGRDTLQMCIYNRSNIIKFLLENLVKKMSKRYWGGRVGVGTNNPLIYCRLTDTTFNPSFAEGALHSMKGIINKKPKFSNHTFFYQPPEVTSILHKTSQSPGGGGWRKPPPQKLGAFGTSDCGGSLPTPRVRAKKPIGALKKKTQSPPSQMAKWLSV